MHELRFIRRARDLGFSVAEIANLLSLWRDRDRQSSQVKAMVAGHTTRLRAKIHDLRAMVDMLQSLADSCSGDDRPDCPIIERLENRQAR